MARLHGVAADPGQLRHEFGESGRAFNAGDLLRAARWLGLKAKQIKSRWTRLAKTQLPALACLNDGQFVVKQHRFRDLYRCLNKDYLLECWHELNRDAASGVDGMTVVDYDKDLEANIEGLVERLKNKRYRAKLVRRRYIPKENGKERPLGIPALEDKLLQMACAKLLAAIYEQEFLSCSYGYRPGRGAREAVKDLTFDLQYGRYGYVIEADVQGFFTHMDHGWLLKMLSLRVDDRAFQGLIRKWLKAGILETDGEVVHPETGTPHIFHPS